MTASDSHQFAHGDAPHKTEILRYRLGTLNQLVVLPPHKRIYNETTVKLTVNDCIILVLPLLLYALVSFFGGAAGRKKESGTHKSYLLSVCHRGLQ